MQFLKRFCFMAILSGGAALLFCACVSLRSLSCPYSVSDMHAERLFDDAESGGFSLSVELTNERPVAIKAFILSCMLYDSEGNNLLLTGSFVEKVSEKIEAFCSETVALTVRKESLDFDSDVCTIDYLYLREIWYEDGSVWKDPYGMYCVFENETD